MKYEEIKKQFPDDSKFEKFKVLFTLDRVSAIILNSDLEKIKISKEFVNYQEVENFNVDSSFKDYLKYEIKGSHKLKSYTKEIVDKWINFFDSDYKILFKDDDKDTPLVIKGKEYTIIISQIIY